MKRAMGLVLAIALFFGAGAGAGATQISGLGDAGIVFGDCTTLEFAYLLTAPATPTGPTIGSDAAVPAGESFTSIPVTIETLTGQESAILVMNEFAQPVACGPIGGVPAPDGSLVAGIAPIGNSGVMGVAYLFPDGSDVIVTLFATDLSAFTQIATAPDQIDNISGEAGTLETVDAGSGAFSATEMAYANQLIFIMETMTASLDQTNALLDDPLPDDEPWNFDLIEEIVTWEDLQDRLHELTPPPSFLKIHQVTVAAFALYVSAGDDLLLGIQDNEPTLIQNGFVKYDLANELIGDASELVNELVDERLP